MTFKQAPRRETDGAVGVVRRADGHGDHLVLTCVTKGEETGVVMSPFNAARAFAMLALMLDIKLPEHIGKAIKL